MPLEPVTYDLVSSSVQAHGKDIKSLTLRPVTGDDLAKCGYPFDIKNMAELAAGNGASPEVEFHAEAVISLVSRLANVPRSTVASLYGIDIYRLNWVVFGLFFPQVPATSSSTPSLLPGSGDNRPANSSDLPLMNSHSTPNKLSD